MVKCLPTMPETHVQSLGQEDLLEMEMVTHSSILAWKIPWLEGPGRLQSMGSQRVGHDWASFFLLSIGKLVKSLSCVWLFVTPLTIAHQAPLSMEFSRQEYWRGLPFPSPGDLPDPGIKPRSSALQADSLPSEPPGIYTWQLINLPTTFVWFSPFSNQIII